MANTYLKQRKDYKLAEQMKELAQFWVSLLVNHKEDAG